MLMPGLIVTVFAIIAISVYIAAVTKESAKDTLASAQQSTDKHKQLGQLICLIWG